MRHLSAAVGLILALFAALPAAADQFNVDRFCPVSWDRTFRDATRQFMPLAMKSDWRRVKAHALQESSCRPDVCSHAGACGVLQLIPETWAHQSAAIRETGSIFAPRHNIRVGTAYLGWLCRQWARRGRTAGQIGDLCAASYISGIGHILLAQSWCGDARLWGQIESCLERAISRESAADVRHYVGRINWWRGRLR